MAMQSVYTTNNLKVVFMSFFGHMDHWATRNGGEGGGAQHTIAYILYCLPACLACRSINSLNGILETTPSNHSIYRVVMLTARISLSWAVRVRPLTSQYCSLKTQVMFSISIYKICSMYHPTNWFSKIANKFTRNEHITWAIQYYQ